MVVNFCMTYPVRNVCVTSQCKLLILPSEGKEIQNCIAAFFQRLLEKMISFFFKKLIQIPCLCYFLYPGVNSYPTLSHLKALMMLDGSMPKKVHDQEWQIREFFGMCENLIILLTWVTDMNRGAQGSYQELTSGSEREQVERSVFASASSSHGSIWQSSNRQVSQQYTCLVKRVLHA